MTKHTCPSELIAAYEWIDSAGEWDEALADPEYAYGAARNAAENDVDVTETDLDRAIEWYREHTLELDLDSVEEYDE